MIVSSRLDRPRHGRKWWVAGLLAVFAAGLGQLYNGQPGRAVAYLLMAVGLAVLSWVGIVSGIAAGVCVALYIGAFIVRIVAVVDGIVTARNRGQAYLLRPCNRVSAYVGWWIVTLCIAVLVRVSVAEAFWIPSGAMLPTLQVGDHLLLNKLRYGLHVPFAKPMKFASPERNDIIVFTSPVDRNIDLMMRVIAVGGDIVEIRKKKLFINGREASEPYTRFTQPEILFDNPRDIFGPTTVPPGKLFVLGDNRDQSYDSRYWGFADEADVKGQAVFIYWSWDSQAHRVRWDRIGKYLR